MLTFIKKESLKSLEPIRKSPGYDSIITAGTVENKPNKCLTHLIIHEFKNGSFDETLIALNTPKKYKIKNEVTKAIKEQKKGFFKRKR